MDNKTMARLLAETADLLEIDGADSFRIRSYRRAAEAAEQTTVDLTEAAADTARLLEIPGIGKSMAANLQAIAATGISRTARSSCWRNTAPAFSNCSNSPAWARRPSRCFGMRPRSAASTSLPRPSKRAASTACRAWASKQIEKLRKGIEDYRRSAGRFRIDVATEEATRIAAYLLKFKGIEKVTPAGSLRRGRETVGDLDLLATGPACAPENTQAAVEYVAAYPGIHDMIAKGENKVSFHLDQGLQVDVRLLPSASYGAALQYFTGSKAHNVVLRQRALKMGYTLSEWALARLDDGSTVAAATEEEIYAALGMDWMPPEMRENLGEIDAAAEHALPHVVSLDDIRGDVHMHTTASDGHNSIREMAEAALACGYKYIAITDHSKNLAMTNGLDEKRALEQIKQVRAVDRADGRPHPRLHRHRGRHPGRRRARPRRRSAGANGHGHRQRSYPFRPEPRGDDGARAPRHREPLRAHPRPSHRPPAPAPRALRHRPGRGASSAPPSWAWPWSTTPRPSGST